MLLERKLLLQEQSKFVDQVWSTAGIYDVYLPQGIFFIQFRAGGGAGGYDGVQAGGTRGQGGAGGWGYAGSVELIVKSPLLYPLRLYVGAGGGGGGSLWRVKEDGTEDHLPGGGGGGGSDGRYGPNYNGYPGVSRNYFDTVQRGGNGGYGNNSPSPGAGGKGWGSGGGGGGYGSGNHSSAQGGGGGPGAPGTPSGSPGSPGQGGNGWGQDMPNYTRTPVTLNDAWGNPITEGWGMGGTVNGGRGGDGWVRITKVG